MSSSTPLPTSFLKKGVHSASTTSDMRSPCPLINCLANNGYIPRDGRNIHAVELVAAMSEVGLSFPLRAVFAHPIFLKQKEPPNSNRAKSRPSLTAISAVQEFHMVSPPQPLGSSLLQVRNAKAGPGRLNGAEVSESRPASLARRGGARHLAYTARPPTRR